jgi:hypothetical protein
MLMAIKSEFSKGGWRVALSRVSVNKIALGVKNLLLLGIPSDHNHPLSRVPVPD